MEQDKRVYIMRMIEMFRQREELWNKNCFAYCRNDLKKKAFKEIAQELNVTEDFIKKKLRALRSTYIIEKRKVERSKRSANDETNVYEPSLFWYNKMTFLDDLIVMRKPIDQIKNNDATDLCERQVNKHKTAKGKVLHSYADPNKTHSNAEEVRRTADHIPASNNSNGSQTEFSINSVSEYEATGINVTRKLEKMNSIQAIYAESLINSVLRNGLLNKLTEDTNLFERPHESQVETSSALFSSEFSLLPQSHQNNISIQSPAYNVQTSRQSSEVEFKVEVEETSN